ncbi:MAG: calcium/sodium antiporter [Bacillota bacterium]
MNKILHDILSQQNLFILFIIISASLYVLSKGADILVDEAVSLSVHWGVPKMIIGATIVSLGTTLPEASVSVMAAIGGNPDLALGNAIGSVIADTGLIIGLAAMLGKLPVDDFVIEKQGKIQFFSGIFLAVLSLPFLSKGSNGHINQWMGFIFLILLAVYIYKSIDWAKKEDIQTNADFKEEKAPIYLQLFKLLIGISLVIGGSKILIPSVELAAIKVGIPQSIIAATLVAFGTSLPELITAITAVKKGHGELAVGNVVGADILNILFVIGASAAVTSTGLTVPVHFYKLQIPTMLIILGAFRYFSKSKEREITKIEGIFLLIIYLIYIVLNYVWL